MFKPNMLYPLRDTSTYGTRYRFALTQAEEVSKECWLLDCWIVDQHGNKCPGVDAVPVPVRLDSVYQSRGVKCEQTYEVQAWCGWR